jgi:hypothetical protein
MEVLQLDLERLQMAHLLNIREDGIPRLPAIINSIAYIAGYEACYNGQEVNAANIHPRGSQENEDFDAGYAAALTKFLEETPAAKVEFPLHSMDGVLLM